MRREKELLGNRQAWKGEEERNQSKKWFNSVQRTACKIGISSWVPNTIHVFRNHAERGCNKVKVRASEQETSLEINRFLFGKSHFPGIFCLGFFLIVIFPKLSGKIWQIMEYFMLRARRAFAVTAELRRNPSDVQDRCASLAQRTRGESASSL